MSDDIHEIYAIKYGRHDRKKADNYIGGPIRTTRASRSTTSCGRSPGRAAISSSTPASTPRWRRSAARVIYKPIAEGLKAIDIAPDSVKNVIVSHLHYDHCGNYDTFPNARFHVQDTEMAYATGRCMCHQHLRVPFEEEDVVAMVRKVFAGRVTFHDGVSQVAPGITVHKIGGHSKGLQCVVVKTKRGPVVLASDTTHLYAHIERAACSPSPTMWARCWTATTR